MTDWLEHTVQIEVPVPIELAWSLWSDPPTDDSLDEVDRVGQNFGR